MNPISQLKNRVLGEKTSPLTPIIKLIRELGCLSEVIGRNFEVFDKKGNLVYKIKQKPITVPQLYTLQDELNKLEKLENKSIKKPGINKRGKK